ncbi:hypothetical protein VPHD478_0040 [Vibrio phage D478]
MAANSSKFNGVELSSIEKMIEDGVVFESSSKIQVASGGGVGKWLVRTGSKKVKILARQIISNGNEMDYQVTGGVTVSSAGTPAIVNNRNKPDAQEPTVKVFHSPTASGGTAISPVYMPGSASQGQNVNGQFSQDGDIRILEPNTDYTAEVVNNGDVTPANVELYIMWAELTEPYPKS